ncbi:MAG TPA: NADH-quinone oxidoreductase subunit L [Clostridia bacterium]|nr:NADH-quinone oxidoreductase subunit L [Clostridia bacterium]
MEKVFLAIAILLPAFSAILCYIIRKPAVRTVIVVLTTLIMFGVAGGFTNLLLDNGGKLTIEFSEGVELSIGWIIKFLDLALLLYILYIGFKLKKFIVIALTLIQMIPLVLFELFGAIKEPEAAFVIDYLSLIMILLVSIIGPIITVFALGYMKEHEHHQGLRKSRQPRFFMILFIFLGAMNALVMTNNLMWMYFFWEVTTLCSFLLISHDGNTQAVNNAVRALWINSTGGVAFLGAIMLIYKEVGSIGVDEIVMYCQNSITGVVAVGPGLLLIALSLLCFAGFTKSAQFPFQSWLLGAMVAPTPVSALLHSSTMVKAGVYLVVRMAPAFSGTMLANVVAVVGGFTFVAGSAIAISQSNGKRVLAYSTIANLGLIVCCAGIGTNIAIGAAMLLMIFHAVSKGLLFLCVGTIEHGIGSRDIEDMQGLMKRMPFTAVITVIGMLSMLLPPFGVLITKWLAIEASVNSPVVLICIILGSAFTVVFWAKWIGIILTMSYKNKYNIEKLPFSIKGSLSIMLVGVLGASIGVVPLYNTFVKPQIEAFGISGSVKMKGDLFGLWMDGSKSFGGFAFLLFFAVVFVIMLLIPIFLKGTKPEKIKKPYLCGENNDDIRGIEFVSVSDKLNNVVVHNYYLSGIFGEEKLTLWTNLVAGAIILIMFGVVI